MINWEQSRLIQMQLVCLCRINIPSAVREVMASFYRVKKVVFVFMWVDIHYNLVWGNVLSLNDLYVCTQDL